MTTLNPNRRPVTTRVSRTGWWFLLPLALGIVSHAIAFLIGRST